MELFQVLTRGNRALDASDVGTGKTYIACYLALLLQLELFVICPLSAIPGWLEVAEQMGIKLAGIANFEMMKNGKYWKDASIVLDDDGEEEILGEKVDCPFIKKIQGQDPDTDSEDEDLEEVAAMEWYEHKPIARKKRKEAGGHSFQFEFPANVMPVVDEAHRGKNVTTSTSKLILALAKIPNKCLLISGTLSDQVKTFKPFGVFFGLYDKPNGYMPWMRRQLKMLRVAHRHSNLNDQQKKLDVIHRTLFPNFAARLRKEDLKHLFQPETIIAKCYSLSASYEIQRLYEELQEVLEELKDKERKKEALGKLQVLRVKIEVLKIPIFIELTNYFLKQGKSVAIFTNFNDSIDHLAHKLKCDCVIRGGQTLKERRAAINRFQTNKSHVILVNIRSGGVALSLHDLHGRPRISLCNIQWSGQDTVQKLGRIHRVGGLSPVEQYLIFVAKTYEERICSIVNEKLHKLQGINDGKLNGQDLEREEVKEGHEPVSMFPAPMNEEEDDVIDLTVPSLKRKRSEEDEQMAKRLRVEEKDEIIDLTIPYLKRKRSEEENEIDIKRPCLEGRRARFAKIVALAEAAKAAAT